MRDLYNKAKNENESVEIKQPQVVDALCSFLGFVDYRDFLKKNLSNKEKIELNEGLRSSRSVFKKQNVIAFAVIIFIIISGVIYFSIDKQQWMVWQENRYIEVPFDTEKIKQGRLKLYRNDRIKDFKKIEADCNTQFFKEDGSVTIWYGKNANKELEYFTSPGLHPETGKTLKSITKYMIDKYICK